VVATLVGVVPPDERIIVASPAGFVVTLLGFLRTRSATRQSLA
jgi:hypothetical protein